MKKIILKDYLQNPIHVYIYEPESEIKGIVHVIHGASEHFARYGLFAEFLNKQGLLGEFSKYNKLKRILCDEHKYELEDITLCKRKE